MGPPSPAGIHFLFPHTLESPNVPRLPPKPLLLSESPWPLLFSLPTSPSGAPGLAPPLPLSTLPLFHLSFSSSVRAFLGAEGDTEAGAAAEASPSLSLPLCPALSPHTLPLPTASITQPRYLPSSSSTHLHQLLLGVPRCLEATVAVPGAPLSLAPGHTARSCWAPVRDLVCARTSGKSKPA